MFSKAGMIIEKNPDSMAYAAARVFISAAGAAIREHGRFTVALSGGSTPRRMHTLLGREPFRSAADWDKIRIFWGDERCVPPEDLSSNYGNACRDFLDHVPIPRTRVHPMPVGIKPDAAASMYQKELAMHLPTDASGFPLFDLILLGIGIDGHIASLFAHQPALDEMQKWVVAVQGEQADTVRLTLTLPVLNRARQIVFMASGKAKSKMLRTLFEEEDILLPARKIQPIRGKLVWILDADAASMLTEI